MDENKPSRPLDHTRSTIQYAINYLTTRDRTSPQKALERIMQEARAKKASLSQVAEAIVNDQEISYRYSAPV
ncbi:MAG: hypothetical protein JW934_18575 [Anaerolineae bacterium]|nr:hypothetical protein [Anaerolineae bacterium]